MVIGSAAALKTNPGSPRADCGLTVRPTHAERPIRGRVLGLDLGNTMPQIGYIVATVSSAAAMRKPDPRCCALKNRIVSEPNEINAAHPAGSAQRPARNTRSSACGGADACGRMHGRPAFAQTPHDRQTHVEHRQEQHQNRQQNWHEHRQIDAGGWMPGRDIPVMT